MADHALAPYLVCERAIAEQAGKTRPFGIGCICGVAKGVPALLADDLHGGQDAIVAVANGYAVLDEVVPQCKHAAVDERVLMVEALVANERWVPMLEEPFGVEVVIVVTRCGHDVDEGIGDGNHVEALLVHLRRICVAVVPKAHQHTVGRHGRHTLCMRQASPEDRLLVVLLDLIAEVHNEFTEALADGRVLVAVLVRSDMEAGAAEDRVWSTKILSIKAVEERNEFRVLEVEMRVVVLLGCQRRTVVRKGEAVGRHVELRSRISCFE